jgi:hypothetical protein
MERDLQGFLLQPGNVEKIFVQEGRNHCPTARVFLVERD